MSSIMNFSNVTLSSLYFDIAKDCLYADLRTSRERRMIIAVLEQVRPPALLPDPFSRPACLLGIDHSD
jgi:isoleucyl-tRNA synthetase